jgi:hypothetical protein
MVAAQIVLLPSAASATAPGPLVVTTTGDVATSTGACGNSGITTPPSPLSLREATCLADNIGGAVTISVPPGTYHLSNGELAVGRASGQNVTITGGGQASTVIDAGGLNRVLDIDQNAVGGVTTSLSGVTISGGVDNTFGGAGIIGGSGNTATLDALTIDSSTITGNHANTGGSTQTNRQGGGVQFMGGQLSITNSTISSNSSGDSPGPGVFYQAQGVVGGEHLTISNDTFSGNSATSDVAGISNGGALAVSAVGSTTYDVTGSRFVNNTAIATGTGTAVGGAIWSESGTLNVSGSTFTGNSSTGGISPAGGAISVDNGSGTLHYNRFTGNTATNGSAVFRGSTAGAVNATDNWWGCNAAPGTTGCDTVAGAPTVSPRLALNAAASPSVVVTPNATSTITAGLTVDSLGAAVTPSLLTAFAGLSIVWTNPLPVGATVSPGSSPISSGTASTTFNSQSTSGLGHVLGGLDNGTATAVITVDQVPAITSANSATFVVGTPASFTVTTTGYPVSTIAESGALPASVTYHDNGNGTATLSGTPTVNGAGYPLALTASNGVNPAATQTLTITVHQAPAFTSSATTTFTVGTAGSFTVSTAGLPTASITETGVLPDGLGFVDNANGTATVSGTPTAGTGGTHPIGLAAANGVNPDASQTLTLTVDEAPVVTTSPSSQTVAPAGSVTFSAAASGYPTPTVQWQRSSNGGMNFSNVVGATSTSYTFTAATGDAASQYRAVFSNVVSTATTAAATLTVGNAPTISSADHATFTVGSAGSFTVTTSGFPNPSLSTTGTMPAWLTFTDNHDGTGLLSGTPPGGSGAAYTFALNAGNGFNPQASQSFTLTVNEPPTISSADHATFTVGSPGSFTVTTVAGYPTGTTLTRTGTLPGGIAFTAHVNGTATFAGTPATGSGGVYPLTLTASNGIAPDATQTFTLTINEPPVITSADHTTFTVGSAGSFTVTTAPGHPSGTTLTSTGTLPSGVTFADNQDGSATLAGTPATDSGGSYPLTVTASNGVAPDARQTFTLTVNQPPTITSADHATFTVGSPGSFGVTTAAGTPTGTTLTSTGTLPSGIAFTAHVNGTATLAGTPATGSGGVYPLTVTASNSIAPDASQAFTLTINEPPVISSADHTTFTVGSAGSFTVTTAPGTPSGTTLTSTGTLPSGVTFADNNDGTATIAGNPATDGVYPLTVTASNGVAPDARQTFTLTSNEPPTITSADHATFTVGSAGSFGVTTAAGTPSGTTLTRTGTLPSGIAFTAHGDGTATIAGTPATGSGGVYPLTLTASNGIAPDATQTFTLTINEPPVITSADHTTFTVGSPGTFTVTTAPGTPSDTTLTSTGTLPSGVTFADNHDGAATIAGTPGTGAGNAYPLTVTASNGVLPNATQSFTLTIDAAPVITTNPASQTVAPGTPVSFTAAASGNPAPTVQWQRSTDRGTSFGPIAGATNPTYTFTPVLGDSTTQYLAVFSNSVDTASSSAATLLVGVAPTISSPNVAGMTVGTASNVTVTTTGMPTPTVAETGVLPAGVSFTSNVDGTATIDGTPTVVTAGSYPITLTAHNGIGADASQAFTLTVSPTLPAAPTSVTATGGDGSATVTFTPPSSNGGAPVTSYTVTSVSGNKTASGTASPLTVPGLTNGVSYSFTVRATNRVGSGPASAPSNTVTPTSTAIAIKYAQLGGTRSFLGAPVGPEYAVAGGLARNYQNGRIYYTPATGAHEVHGAILAHYLGLGGPASVLGFPVTDETMSWARNGSYNHFAGATGSSIFWSPATGAWEVQGTIRTRWISVVAELGRLGYPVSDEFTIAGGRRSNFQHGFITWRSSDGSSVVNFR